VLLSLGVRIHCRCGVTISSGWASALAAPPMAH
jgi:hypothetical protein